MRRSKNAAAQHPLPRRPYGRDGTELSIVGFGGMLVKDAAPKEAARMVAEAVEQGVNYFDVAPTYGDAEEKLGPALSPYRRNIFLACKTTQRRREGAEAELRRSLDRLRTDHLDLYQLHALTSVQADVDPAFSGGGAMEALLEAKKAGVVRYIGFSTHSTAAALAAMDRYDFDSVLFPLNFACFQEGRFGPQILERAQSKGAARLALKALARQRWPARDPRRAVHPKCWYQPISDRREAELALRFTLNQPITSALTPGEEGVFRMALEIACHLQPLTVGETQELAALAATLDPLFREA